MGGSAQREHPIKSALGSVGLGDRAQCRVLLCEGQRVLTWLGVFRPEPFGARDEDALGEEAHARHARAGDDRVRLASVDARRGRRRLGDRRAFGPLGSARDYAPISDA